MTFPTFNRGPLDINVQLRGYEGFIDDWVNVPFISPALFRDFVLPLYHRLKAQ